MHSFVRPTVSELYALKHSDIGFSEEPEALLLHIRRGKTGNRTATTMPAAVAIYKRIKKRNPSATGVGLPVPAGIRTAQQRPASSSVSSTTCLPSLASSTTSQRMRNGVSIASVTRRSACGWCSHTAK